MALRTALERLSDFDLPSRIESLPLSAPQLGILAVVAASVVWAVALCVYRLYFSPLAGFPGDKLAAATGWVETYHDVFRGGQFIFKIEEWHAKYGPIVRINPWEVHIADPDFADVMLAGNSQFDKKIEWKARFGIPHSTFDTIEHRHHRARRSAVAPFFSKQKINGITDFIAQKAQRLCDRLEREYKARGRPVVLNNCFTALTFDIITHYAFARSFEYVEYPDFKAPFTNAAKELATTLHTMGHFPWLRSILQAIPKPIAAALNPAMGAVFAFHGEIEDQIRAIYSGDNSAHKDVGHKTVFSELINSDLPPQEKAVERLKHEGASIVAGGVETTATALSKAIFFILSRPDVHARLQDELRTAFPDARQTPGLATLEALPYLSAVVSETLRLTIGISQRTIRRSRAAAVRYRPRGGSGEEVVIPPGAYFSMTTYLTHKDPAVWEDPGEFRPERWLPRDGGAGGKQQQQQPLALNGQPLGRYLMPFGKGPRMCLGMNLARAELFIGLAVVLRRCGGMELFETGREAVEMKADYFIPLPDPKVEGVKVLLK